MRHLLILLLLAVGCGCELPAIDKSLQPGVDKFLSYCDSYGIPECRARYLSLDSVEWVDRLPEGLYGVNTYRSVGGGLRVAGGIQLSRETLEGLPHTPTLYHELAHALLFMRHRDRTCLLKATASPSQLKYAAANEDACLTELFEEYRATR